MTVIQRKPEYVYAILIRTRDNAQLMFERGDTGAWTLIGGAVLPEEDPRDALERHLRAQWNATCEVIIEEQVGPLHISPDGSRAAIAFSCYAAEWEGEAIGEFAQLRAFNEEDVLSGVPVDGSLIERIVWDGFSILHEPTRSFNADPSGREGVYCDPGREHILVEELGDDRLERPRLDPKNGQPMAAL